MRGKPTTFWGKLDTDDAGEISSWHPLIHHCIDVAACAEFFLQETGIGDRMRELCGLKESDCQTARLSFIAGLHDLGKFNTGFQKRLLCPRQPGTGHIGPVLSLFVESSDCTSAFAAAIDFGRLVPWCESEQTICQLIAASVCHHGRPLVPQRRSNPYLWRPWRSLDPFRGIAELVSMLQGCFSIAFDGSQQFSSSPSLQHALSGLITLADWLASDVRFFPFSEELYDDRMTFARKQCREVARTIGLDTGHAHSILTQAGCPEFTQVWDHNSPHSVQECIIRESIEMGPEITIMESDTGSGKTEAALYHFFRLFEKGAVDGLYFALPTRTSAVQIFDRVREAVERVFGSAAPPVVLAVPGYLRVDNKTGKRLAPFECLWGDDSEGRYRYRAWAAEQPKRYFAGAIAVGTVDQVLLSGLAVRHSHMRAVCLLRHLIVVDEVHASDAYMTSLLRSVLSRHCEAGGHALLMSATLGSSATARLSFPRVESSQPSLEEALSVPYPLVRRYSQDDGAVTPMERISSADSRGKRIEIDLRPCADSPEVIVGHAIAAAKEGAKVIILRNTVADALATQEALEDDSAARGVTFQCSGVSTPHHSRYACEDRKRLDAAIEAVFGKNREKGGCVAVATQTVQQSLDLDADLMLTDICPMDVLLQRAGRLHRHSQRSVSERPERFRKPLLVVLVPEKRDLECWISGKDGFGHGPHGLGTVYDDLRILEATWRLLENNSHLQIPQMNRFLVEHATHPQVLQQIVEDLGGRWQEHANSAFVRRIAERQAAHLNLADWSMNFGGYSFPDDRENSIATRLGASDLLVRFKEPVSSPFGEHIGMLTIPHFQAPDNVPDDGQAENIREEGGRVEFYYGDRNYVYDRLGLRPLSPD